ncbi:MAG: sulfatase-like hydrolase/transferase [Armatimonadetes bacterium]|nr:sulfatase-like hydrolase/transferase [Armatimonadota bacterium]
MSARRPNILLITSDQQHWRTMGFLNPEVKTPHLDRLAREGSHFPRTYCPNPTCSPTRASMITGKYPSQHGCWSLGTKLPESEHTVGEDFAAAGYRTALVGKAHFQPLASTAEFPSLESRPIMQDLDFWRHFHGPFYGFEHVELARNHTDEPLVGQHYALWMEEKGFTQWRECFRKPTGTAEAQYGRWNLPEEFHYDTWIAERTNALMAQYAGKGEPFLLWASFFDPHPPYIVPEPWDTLYDPRQITVPDVTPGEHDRNPPHFRLTREEHPDFTPWSESGQSLHGFHSHLRSRERKQSDAAIYYGMISLMDKFIGKILDQVDALGLAEETLVVFSCDHGHFYGQHGLTAKGAFHYEDMIRVPFLVRWPGKVPAGRTSPALQTLVDLPTTLLSACGLPAPRTMVGADQLPVWRGEQESARDHVVVENRHEPTTIHVKTYVDERYKLTVYYQRDYGELFDLKDDPGEVHNLWSDPGHAALKAELVMKLLFAEMGKEPLWMPRVWGA